jgi:hypothetical protein
MHVELSLVAKLVTEMGESTHNIKPVVILWTL